MSTGLIISLLVGYFGVLVAISYLTTKKSTNESFYTGDRSSPWYLVAFGMIGASLSGVTFISVPGWVGGSQFSYMQMVFGYVIGYFFIAYVLLPIYYKLNLVSIYQYLEQRFGIASYKTGATFFLISRVIGASFRLFLVAMVLQYALFERRGVDMPFWVIVLVAIALIWVYTFRGGIKTVVWTDTLQTFFMLAGMIICVVLIAQQMGWGFGDIISNVSQSENSQIFFFDDFSDRKHFVKQLLSGAFMAIVMTGLDQDMMQKNLTCRSLKDAQKNMVVFSLVLVVVNLAFLTLGAMLLHMDAMFRINTSGSDSVFGAVALNELGLIGGTAFILGVIAAAYSSADSALTSLTTSLSVDFLGATKEKPIKKSSRNLIHAGFSLLLFVVIVVFDMVAGDGDTTVIATLFKAAGYTYGPLLGLYACGIFTKIHVNDKWVPVVCVVAPAISYLITYLTDDWFGFSILIVNGFLTFVGLLLISGKKYHPESKQLQA